METLWSRVALVSMMQICQCQLSRLDPSRRAVSCECLSSVSDVEIAFVEHVGVDRRARRSSRVCRLIGSVLISSQPKLHAIPLTMSWDKLALRGRLENLLVVSF